jgi:hypothetical protein
VLVAKTIDSCHVLAIPYAVMYFKPLMHGQAEWDYTRDITASTEL